MKKDIEKKISRLVEEWLNIDDPAELDINLNDKTAKPESDIPEFNYKQAEYDPLKLTDLQRELASIVLDYTIPFKDILPLFSNKLLKFFKSRYVEFFLVEHNYLRYEYINVPAFLSKLINKITGITAIEGMKIPLFDGSFFKEFVDKKIPREIITYEDRLHSFKDFLPPDSKKNIELREKWAPRLMPLFSYKYVFQVPLIQGDNLIGYFSFLQEKRMTPRVRADIILMSSQIANLLDIRRQTERRKFLFDSLPYPTINIKAKTDQGGSYVIKYIIQDINPLFETLTGLDKQKLLNKNLSVIPFFQKNLLKEKYLDEVFYTSAPIQTRIDFNDKFFNVIISMINFGEIIITIEDITRQINTENEIKRLAGHDSLTNLYNRYFFLGMLKHEINICNRENKFFLLLFLDLNHFKDVNDSYGHETGDLLLKHIADILIRTFRESDIICRLGGDEFIILCRNTGRSDGEIIAEKIHDMFDKSNFVSGDICIKPSTSIGISVFPDNSRDSEKLISSADIAMYKSKKDNIKYYFADE